MKRGVCAALSIGLLAGCGVRIEQTSETTDAGRQGTTVTTEVTTDPGPESDAAISTTAPPPPTTSEAPPQPVEIEQTLVRLSDTSMLGTLAPDPNPDPSPIDGDAVPARPQARCGIAADRADDPDVDLLGCEFDSVDAATAYLQQWNAAVALPNPQWRGQTAATTPVDAAAGWTGRTLSVVVPGEEFTRLRVDLVQQRGPRVYVATAYATDGAPDSAVAAAVDVAQRQQSFLDERGIGDATPIGGNLDIGRISVRYLAPTWAELTAAAPTMTGPANEYVWIRKADADGRPQSEGYTRVLTGPDADEWGTRLRLSASIERYATVEEAKRSALGTTGLDCVTPLTPVEGSVNTFACPTDYQSVVVARHDNYLLTMLVPAEIDAASAQQMFSAWNASFLARALPTAAAAPPNTAMPRSANPLPTDVFPAGGFDGSYLRTWIVSRVDATGAYIEASADYDKTPGRGGQPYTDNSYNVSIVSADSEVGTRYSSDADLVGPIGEITGDAWTTVIWRTYADSDSVSFDAQMMRLLPSGDRLEVSDSMYFYPAVEQPNPPFAVDGPLLTSVWDSLQGFSLAGFTADPPEVVAARDLARDLVNEFTFVATNEVQTVYAQVAPDSPAGTVAEWRKRSEPVGELYQPPPAVDHQVIAFDSDASAANFVGATAGVPMTPIDGIDGVDGVEARFSADAGLVILRRGKWVMRVSSPGRTSWQSEYGSSDNPIAIDRFARYAAELFAAANLA